MAVAPKKTKYKSTFVRYNRGNATNGTELEFGDVGIISLENAFITPNQIEAARRVISHVTKRTGRVSIRIFPEQAITKKPPNVRMGSGKGAVDHYSAPVKAGKILFEIGGIDKNLATEALMRAAKKLPVSVRIIEKM